MCSGIFLCFFAQSDPILHKLHECCGHMIGGMSCAHILWAQHFVSSIFYDFFQVHLFIPHKINCTNEMLWLSWIFLYSPSSSFFASWVLSFGRTVSLGWACCCCCCCLNGPISILRHFHELLQWIIELFFFTLRFAAKWFDIIRFAADDVLIWVIFSRSFLLH